MPTFSKKTRTPAQKQNAPTPGVTKKKNRQHAIKTPYAHVRIYVWYHILYPWAFYGPAKVLVPQYAIGCSGFCTIFLAFFYICICGLIYKKEGEKTIGSPGFCTKFLAFSICMYVCMYICIGYILKMRGKKKSFSSDE